MTNGRSVDKLAQRSTSREWHAVGICNDSALGHGVSRDLLQITLPDDSNIAHFPSVACVSLDEQRRVWVPQSDGAVLARAEAIAAVFVEVNGEYRPIVALQHPLLHQDGESVKGRHERAVQQSGDRWVVRWH